MKDLGLKLVRRMVEEPGALSALQDNGFLPEMVQDEARRAHDWALQFLRDNGQLPSIVTMSEALSLTFPDAIEPVTFYFAEAFAVWKKEAVKRGFSEGVEEIKRNELDKALEAVIKTATRIKSAGPGLRSLINLTDPVQVDARIAAYDRIRALGDELEGIPTPWKSINEATRGIRESELWVILGKLKSGKTWLEVVMALYAWESGRAKGRKVLLVSEEMGIQAIARRWDAVRSRLPYSQFRTGKLDSFVEARWKSEMEALKNAPPFLIAGKERVRNVLDLELLLEEASPDIVFVDGAYFLEATDSKSKWDRTSAVIDGLQSLVQRKKVPIVVTWQFNRTVKTGKTEGNAENVAFAYEVMQNCDCALGVFRNATMEERKQAKLTMIESRESKKVNPLLIEYDLDDMRFGELREMRENEDSGEAPITPALPPVNPDLPIDF